MTPEELRGRRAEILVQAKVIVVKVGSAVLASDRGLDARSVERLVDQLSGLHDAGRGIVLVTSGAVAAGRMRIEAGLPHAAGLDFSALPVRQAASAIGQSRLMHAYDEAFERFGKTVAQILLTREDLRSRARFGNARNTMLRLLQWGVIPIVNENDTIAVAELKFGDNDTLSSLVVDLVDADLFVNLTSADGVFDKNPDAAPGARRLPCIEDIEDLDIGAMCSGKTSVGSGGMYSKLRAARRAAQLGVATLIVSGRDSFSLERVFKGEELGTLVLPCRHTVSHHKFWIAYHDAPAGSILVDAGAARAVREQGKSLLCAGVRSVEGDFGPGALVRILDPEGHAVGVGTAGLGAADLRRVMGCKTSEVRLRLGPQAKSVAVHRDNLLLAAL